MALNGSDTNIVKLWILRCLILLKGHKSLLGDVLFSDEQQQLASYIGLEKTLAVDSDHLPEEILQELKHLYISCNSDNVSFPKQLEDNLTELSKAIEISCAEKTLLGFLIVINNEPALYTAVESIGTVSSKKAIHCLSVILDIDEQVFRHDILKGNGMLIQAGLVEYSFFGGSELYNKLHVFSQEFAEQMYSFRLKRDEIFKVAANKAPSAFLNRSNYEHLHTEFDLAKAYLNGVRDRKIVGVNILLYGPPGTGKTELSRTLAKSAKLSAFEIIGEDDEQEPICGSRRLNAYRLAQNLLQTSNSLIVFDETEDVFNNGNWFTGVQSTAQKNKAWFNKLLEENRVPSIWIANDISQIDPAFIRRFDLVIEIQSPPQTYLKKVLKHSCNGLIDVHTKGLVLDAEGMSPALLHKAGKVLQSIEMQSSHSDLDEAFYSIVNSNLKAQGFSEVKPRAVQAELPKFDFSCTNSPENLDALMQGLVHVKQGRVCLYGPPGTGKTEFGKELSKRTGLKLLTQKVSDLVSPYVGESEKNIALAFERASDENAILMIDEVDSFLRDRRMANQNWEVTMVNEMLTQMESFSGVMIASTNLMDGFDQAVLRRFDLKVKLDFLLPEQSWKLFKKYCRFLGVKGAGHKVQKELSTYQNLAPGDFATIARRAKILCLENAEDVLHALKKETELKGSSSKPIGFIH